MKNLLFLAMLFISINAFANELEITNSGYEGVSIRLYQNNEFMGVYFIAAHSTSYIDIGSAACYLYTYSVSGQSNTYNFYSCAARVW